MPQSYGTFVIVDGGSLSALKTAPERYESSVIELLRHISRFKVGWHVLNAIKKSGKKVLIRPGEENGATDLNIVRIEQPYLVNRMCELDSVDCPPELLERVFVMPHRLGDVFIFFKPDHPVKPFLPSVLLRGLPGDLVKKLFPYDKDPRWRPEDLLVHELFHALRILVVPNVFSLDRRLPKFSSVEELYAILVTNMYCSEQGRDHDLRGSHSATYDVLDSNDLKIRLDYGLHLTRLESEMPELTSKLRALPMKFNPFRIQI